MSVESSLEGLKALVQEIGRRMEALEARLQPEPTCLTFPAAAQRLGVGLTKLKEMVRARDIHPVLVGRVKMIPLSEIHRVSTPRAEQPKQARATRSAAWVPLKKR